jgi:hypothetical protein
MFVALYPRTWLESHTATATKPYDWDMITVIEIRYLPPVVCIGGLCAIATWDESFLGSF